MVEGIGNGIDGRESVVVQIIIDDAQIGIY